ncbi:uncharacterized protein LOC117654164 [Thrips palmi]|uniref:Uncharacterized protein LOC117654164 n=1 Tax=Thrips palmi TaxID=161013 RepID=A0A6P9AL83_THRPL|nr:uncharacterized protein LOC117654164 [Thrips palmi]
MNFKALAAAVALLAICAEARIIGSDGGDQVDLADKDLDLGLDLQVLGAGLGDKLVAQHRLDATTQSLDGILRAVQDVLNRVDAVLQATYSAVLNAVTAATQAAQAATQAAVNSWNQALQNVINRNDAVNAAVQQCRAQQPTLQSVADALGQDVQLCVQNASASATNTLAQLQTLRVEAQTLANDAQQAIADCRPSGWLAAVCVINKLPRLTAESLSLVGDATRLAAQVTGQLVVQIPLRSAACVGDAINTRGAAANAIITAVRQCVDASLNPATAATAATATSTPAPSG